MKKYINPTTEVMHVEAMHALCDSVPMPGSSGHAPKRRDDVF